jgi:type I restriction enzyme R subunit
VAEDEEELGTDKLPDLPDLRYGSPTDAVRGLGSVSDIRSTFTGFQKGLYEN